MPCLVHPTFISYSRGMATVRSHDPIQFRLCPHPHHHHVYHHGPYPIHPIHLYPHYPLGRFPPPRIYPTQLHTQQLHPSPAHPLTPLRQCHHLLLARLVWTRTVPFLTQRRRALLPPVRFGGPHHMCQHCGRLVVPLQDGCRWADWVPLHVTCRTRSNLPLMHPTAVWARR